MNKYHNRRVTKDGMTFDSKKEYDRYCELLLLQKAGEIKDLKRQVKFVLIPAQRDNTNEVDKNVRLKKGKLLERECSYFADFVYVDCNSGKTIVEDSKGYRTKEYIIKRKLMLYVHGIQIREV